MDDWWEEMKTKDTAVSGDVNSTPVEVLLNGIAQGTDDDQRVGNLVYMDELLIRLHISNETAVKDRLSQMRVLVVYDTQSNGTAVTTANVLDAVTLEAQLNFDNESRYVVLVDEMVPLNTYGGSATSVDVYHWFYEKCVKLVMPVRYKSTGGAITDINYGALYLLYFGPDAASVNDFDCVGTARLSFFDQ